MVDTGALLSELNRRRLRAALDVTDPEGGMGAWHVAARQIAAYAAGEDPPNLVPA